MRKIKISFFYTLVLIVGLVFTSTLLKAQSAEEALKQLDVEKFESANSTIKKAIEKEPSEASNYFYAGYIYLQQEKLDSAKYFFDKGVSVDAKAPLNYVGQGFLALNNNKIQEAQGLFDKAIDLSKEKDPVVYNRIAEALIFADNKDANKALSYLNKSLSLKKRDKDKAASIEATTHLLMGDAYLALKDGGKAISEYEKAVYIDKTLAKAYAKIGRIYLIPRNYEAAEAEFQKAVEANPNYAPIYKDLGELYFTKRNISKAKEMYNKYMQLSDVQKGSRSRYAIFVYLTRDYPAAINELKQALTIEPNNIVLHRLLGYSLFQTGDYEAAKESMDKYFSLV
ncbi:MAG TPA: tetratricopeptide repeat protein, partial [Cytophagales bacterium]|nr:tetratricopeptide repeat protein [Cytophagales bacterium]